MGTATAMFPSVIKPLAKKVAIFKSHINDILVGLINGDPEAIKQVKNLQKDLAKFFQECQSSYATLNSSWQTSLSAASGMYNPMPMFKMIAFYIGEVIYAIQLIGNLMSLIANLVSITTILVFLTNELLKLQKALNAPLIWLNRSIARAKQRLAKKIEWQKRIIMANLNIIYYTGQQKAYEDVLSQLEAKLPKKPEPQLGINGYYGDNGIFIYYDKPLNLAVTNAIQENTNAAASNPLNINQSFSQQAGLVPPSLTSSLMPSNPTLNTPSITSGLSTSTVNFSVAATSTPTIASNATLSQAAASVSVSEQEAIGNNITMMKAKLLEISVNMEAAKREIDPGIPNEKEYYYKLWDKQQKQDTEQLLKNNPFVRTIV